MRKLILLLILLGFSTSLYAVTCDETKVVNGKNICVINVPLDIPQTVIDGFGIEFYAQANGWNAQVPDPECTPAPALTCPECTDSPEVTCTPEEEANGCVPAPAFVCAPCTPQDAVTCSMVNNPESALEFSKKIIRGKVKEDYIVKYKAYVATQSAITAENTAKSLFPEG